MHIQAMFSTLPAHDVLAPLIIWNGKHNVQRQNHINILDRILKSKPRNRGQKFITNIYMFGNMKRTCNEIFSYHLYTRFGFTRFFSFCYSAPSRRVQRVGDLPVLSLPVLLSNNIYFPKLIH